MFHLKEPFATLLWNLSDGAIGIVPYGSGDEISRHPIGSGPFRFVSAEPDKEVVIERNDNYWGEKAHLQRVRFAVVPDATTRALELRKGSADIAVNSLTADMVLALERESDLQVLHAPGNGARLSGLQPARPSSERCAGAAGDRPMPSTGARSFTICCAISRGPRYSLLPPESWAYNGDVPHYDYNPERARQLLEQPDIRR